MRTVASVVVVLAVVSACAVVLSSPARAQSVTATCDAPPANRDGCNHWYTSQSVILDWTWNPAAMTATGCGGATFTGEGLVQRSCTVDFSDTTITKKVWIGVDRTPPQVVALQPARPPDFNGWFNSPVGLTFQGSDAISGVASCSSTAYAGPDGAGIPISGSCRDVAGNVGFGALPLNYDATPPPAPVVHARPGNTRVALRWSMSPGTEAEVVRFRKRMALVYRGPLADFTDRKLRNGRRYAYLVTLIDQAGNRAAGKASAVPTGSRLLLPPQGARVNNPPMLVWKPVRKARYYNAQLLRHRHKILTRWPTVARLQLRRSWRFAGHRRKLVPGRYCWYVWPAFGRRSKHRYGRLLGSRCFKVVRE